MNLTELLGGLEKFTNLQGDIYLLHRKDYPASDEIINNINTNRKNSIIESHGEEFFKTIPEIDYFENYDEVLIKESGSFIEYNVYDRRHSYFMAETFPNTYLDSMQLKTYHVLERYGKEKEVVYFSENCISEKLQNAQGYMFCKIPIYVNKSDMFSKYEKYNTLQQKFTVCIEGTLEMVIESDKNNVIGALKMKFENFDDKFNYEFQDNSNIELSKRYFKKILSLHNPIKLENVHYEMFVLGTFKKGETFCGKELTADRVMVYSGRASFVEIKYLKGEPYFRQGSQEFSLKKIFDNHVEVKN